MNEELERRLADIERRLSELERHSHPPVDLVPFIRQEIAAALDNRSEPEW